VGNKQQSEIVFNAESSFLRVATASIQTIGLTFRIKAKCAPASLALTEKLLQNNSAALIFSPLSRKSTWLFPYKA
jgi:hypothetical protein